MGEPAGRTSGHHAGCGAAAGRDASGGGAADHPASSQQERDVLAVLKIAYGLAPELRQYERQ